jgi:hypothetical protein
LVDLAAEGGDGKGAHGVTVGRTFAGRRPRYPKGRPGGRRSREAEHRGGASSSGGSGLSVVLWRRTGRGREWRRGFGRGGKRKVRANRAGKGLVISEWGGR